MAEAAGSTGTTVTVFGGSDALDHAIGTHLEQRGCKTHFVSVPTGWLRSAAHVVMRLDTVAGANALKQLTETPQPRSHVIAVCPELSDAAESERVREMCRSCGVHHDVSLIWHSPLDGDTTTFSGGNLRATNALAASVADEMAEHPTVGQPAFVTRPFILDPDH